MRQSNDDVRIHPLGFLQIGSNLRRVHQVHIARLRHRQTVGAISEVQQDDSEPVFLDEERIVLLSLANVPIGSKMIDAHRIHHRQRTFQAFPMRIDAMVVGCEHDVETSTPGATQEVVWSRELREAAIRSTSQRCLEIGNGHIGTLHLVLDASKAFIVIIGAVGLLSSLDLWHMLHQVASNEER